MQRPLRIGLFGASNILERTMGDGFLSHPNFIINGLASKSKERAKLLSNKFKCKQYNCYDSLINKDIIDAAYISLPNSIHYDLSKKLLKNGIHCLVEKPLACSYEQCTEVNTLAKSLGLTLMETFQFQYHSQFKYIKNRICDNSLGELRAIDIKFGFPLINDVKNIRLKRNLGGGAFLDTGVYITKSACLLTNTMDANILSNINYLEGYEVDMYGSCLIKTKDKISILGSWGFDNSYKCCLELWFSKGQLASKRIFSAKKEFISKLKIIDGDKELIEDFKDDQYYNTIEEFYLTINSQSKMKDNYIANINQSNLMSKIYEH